MGSDFPVEVVENSGDGLNLPSLKLMCLLCFHISLSSLTLHLPLRFQGQMDSSVSCFGLAGISEFGV